MRVFRTTVYVHCQALYRTELRLTEPSTRVLSRLRLAEKTWKSYSSDAQCQFPIQSQPKKFTFCYNSDSRTVIDCNWFQFQFRNHYMHPWLTFPYLSNATWSRPFLWVCYSMGTNPSFMEISVGYLHSITAGDPTKYSVPKMSFNALAPIFATLSWKCQRNCQFQSSMLLILGNQGIHTEMPHLTKLFRKRPRRNITHVIDCCTDWAEHLSLSMGIYFNNVEW